MIRVLLFAGTTEGRVLAEGLADVAAEVTISVATEYGREVLSGIPDRFRVLIGRLDIEEMRELIRYKHADMVVDATHPYAVAASENIRSAAESESVEYVRLIRAGSPVEDCEYVPSVVAAAAKLAGGTGKALLATGSKELAAYTVVPGFAERFFPRVLPTVESIRECERLGFQRSHIIAMQGPFGRELNRAIMEQFGIGVMVTKDGGKEGGFPEKMLAAHDAGVRVLVVGRPPEGDGMDAEQVLAHIRRGAEARQ